MPKILLPKITGPLWQLAHGPHAPKSQDHLHAALHEAGHAAASMATTYARQRHAYVRTTRKFSEFTGMHSARFEPPAGTASIDYLRALTLWSAGGLAAESKVSETTGPVSESDGVTWGALVEAQASFSTYLRHADKHHADETAAILCDTFDTPSIKFQQVFARMMLPAHMGRHGGRPAWSKPHGLYYGFSCTDAWWEWLDLLDEDDDVEYSQTWQHFVTAWGIERVQFVAPNPKNVPGTTQYFHKKANEDAVTAGIFGDGLMWI